MNFPIPLKRDGIVLRPFMEGDETSISKNASNVAIWNNVRDRFPHPYTIDDAIAWIQICSHSEKPNQLAIVFNDEVIGGIGIVVGNDIEKISAEIGYWLAEMHWNKGIISDALSTFLIYVFTNFHSINRVFASVFPYNIASIKVLERTGFRQEAILKGAVIKNNQIYDSIIYAFNRPDWEKLNSNK